MKKRNGINSVVRGVQLLLRVDGTLRKELKALLTPAEFALYSGLLDACRAFIEALPMPGIDDDPGTQA